MDKTPNVRRAVRFLTNSKSITEQSVSNISPINKPFQFEKKSKSKPSFVNV